jgi:hypothetical protein
LARQGPPRYQVGRLPATPQRRLAQRLDSARLRHISAIQGWEHRVGIPTHRLDNSEAGEQTRWAERPAALGPAIPGPGDLGYYPPGSLIGPDPDKEGEKFYGVEIGSETNLRRAMAPPEVDDDVAKDLAAVMLDSVAVPGTSSQSSGGLDLGDTESG